MMVATAGDILRSMSASSKPKSDSERAVFKAMRAALLMQVRWIEQNLARADSPLLTEFFTMQRRSLLEIVREIEHEAGIKPKKAKVKKGEKKI